MFTFYNLIWQSEDERIEFITGCRKPSDFFWAFIVFLGSSGLLLVATASYLRRNALSFFPSEDTLVSLEEIDFIPQGAVVTFYGISGLFISFHLWCTIFWNIGSGYDRFDRKEGIVCIFRWGFPGKNRRIFRQFLMKDIQSIIIETKKSYTYHVLYMEIRGEGAFPLTRTDDNWTPLQIAQKAADLSRLLRVPIEIVV